ncbi:hypothetical protein [Aquimarina algicola]|uniref:Uncharacterized protein n=1 Tax=Aquimarina algicola TaxID=2589995 RepID=A0A504J7X4_9FLAO|nr:hypothetical protein [Aquimarina algicola]TPN82790.1 hypothetical protein FHK87_20395 [Aquimarina algicola]
MKIEELQSGILITNFAAAADGGSLFFECETTQKAKFNLLFTQYVFLDNPDPEMIPGRIYLNQKIIDLKSKEEKMILLGLKNFNVSHELLDIDPNMKSELTDTINELSTFFNSELSIEIKKKVDNTI